MPMFKKRENTNPVYTGNPDEYRMSVIEHLEDLRRRIVVVVSFLIVFTIIGWNIFEPLYAWINGIADRALREGLPNGRGYTEVMRHFSDAFMLQLRLSFVIGLSMTFPVIVYQIWGFIAPALKPNEQAPFRRLAPFSILLFLAGCGFCLLIIRPALVYFAQFFGNWRGVELMQDAGTLVFFVLKMMLAFGVAFQLPLIVYGMGLAGLLSAETLLRNWRQGATIVFIASAIITPSNDAFSMLMMALPMTALFAISVFAVNRAQKSRKEAEFEDLSPYQSLD